MRGGEYVTLKAVTSFAAFPAASFDDSSWPWSVFLLESYRRDYSNKFRLINVHYPAIGSCTGVIVKKGAPFRSYNDVLADFLGHHRNAAMSEGDALRLLQTEGFIAVPHYKGIGTVLKKARSCAFTLDTSQAVR